MSERWTSEQIERLRRLWARGCTAREIGLFIGKSKNSVVGKAQRLGLDKRENPVKRKLPDQPAAQPHRQRPAARSSRLMPLPPLPPGGCQYIAGEPSADDACKCGRPRVEGRPYCAEHDALCRPRPEEAVAAT